MYVAGFIEVNILKVQKSHICFYLIRVGEIMKANKLLICLLLLSVVLSESFVEPPSNSEVKKYCSSGGGEKSKQLITKDTIVGACLSWASYEMDKRQDECDMVGTNVLPFGGGKGFVQLGTGTSQKVKVVFRGTVTVQDLKDDIDFQTTAFLNDNSRQVHKGYMMRYITIRNNLLLLLSSSKSRPVQFIGHGSGAALAVIAAKDFVELNPNNKNVSILTFGEPPFCSPSLNNFITLQSSNFEKNQRFVLTSVNYVLDPITTFGEGNFTHPTPPIFLCSELSIIRKADILLLHKAESYLSFLSSQVTPTQLTEAASKGRVVSPPPAESGGIIYSVAVCIFSAGAVYVIHRRWLRRRGYHYVH